MIKIAHLYPELLSLYGENGNIKALKYALEKKNAKVKIINVTKTDEIKFSEYDFVYIGSGRSRYLKEAKELLEPYKNDILDYIKKEKLFLVTGNAVSILDFLDLYKVETCKSRKVADVSATTSLCEENILGFQNTEYLIKDTNHILFNMNEGYGNKGTLMEGYNVNNFYATTIIGPLLARNDNLTNYLVDILLENNTN